MVTPNSFIERLSATDGSDANRSAPISAHPLFPAIVALWFAALFGLGTFVLPSALFERLVTAINLPSLIASTAPPLGFTAHLMIACAAAIAGAAAGYLLARKVSGNMVPAPKRSRRPVQSHPAPFSAGRPVNRPISAMEELGSQGLDEPVADAPKQDGSGAKQENLNGRRRRLSVTDENARSDYLVDVPLPGADPYAADYTPDTAAIDPAQDQVFKPAFDAASDTNNEEALDLTTMETAPTFETNFVADDADAVAEFAAQTAELANVAQPAPHHTAPDGSSLNDLDMVALVERFAHALKSHRDREETARAEAEAQERDRAEAAAREADAPLNLPSFGSLAATDASSQNAAASSPAPNPKVEAEPTPDFAALSAIPDFLRPIAADNGGLDGDTHDDDDDDVLDLSFPSFAAPPESVSDNGSDDGDSDDDIAAQDEPGAAFLLSMPSRSQPPREFVRIEDGDIDDADVGEDALPESVVVFPNAEKSASRPPEPVEFTPEHTQIANIPATIDDETDATPASPTPMFQSTQRPAPSETEQALRNALEKLQRMSG